MILVGRLLTEEGAGVSAARPGAIRIEGERIVEVLGEVEARALEGRAGEVAADGEIVGGRGWLIAPGFVDAHVHVPQFDSMGRAGMPLLEWLQSAVFPAEARWEDAEFARGMTRRVAGQLLANGTTAVGAYATVHHAATRAAMEALAESGIAGVVGQVLMDREAPPALVRPAKQLLEEAGSFERVGRVKPAVTPRFAIACTPELLEGAGDLAREKGWPVQTHLAETLPECRRVAELFGGERYVEVYRRAGLLVSGALMGHAIHLDEVDRRALAAASVVAAHCPLANSFLGSGEMDLWAHREAGVVCALGSDVAAGYERSMVRVARGAIETAARVAPDRAAPCAGWGWWQVTAGNAGALGLNGGGRLVVGAAADVVAIKPDIPWIDAPDPLAVLMFAWDDRWLKGTWTLGRLRASAT